MAGEVRSTINVKDEHRTLGEFLKNNNILGFNGIENKDIFMFAVSLGLDTPTSANESKGLIGWFRTSYVKSQDSALYRVILLGKSSEEQVEENIELEKNYIQAERCADNGFKQLKKEIDDVNEDWDLLAKRMMRKLEILYQTNVVNK